LLHHGAHSMPWHEPSHHPARPPAGSQRSANWSCAAGRMLTWRPPSATCSTCSCQRCCA
jgi:hypothetical protein